MEILFFAAILGIIAGMIAGSKGRNFFLWFVYGMAIAIIAIPHALLLKPDRKTLDQQAANSGDRKCPFCAEMVRKEAIVCKHCGRDIAPPSEARATV